MAFQTVPQVVNKFADWNQGDGTIASIANIERVMDNAAYTSAHPDDTFVFAGPPRLNLQTDDASIYQNYSAVGMLQNITFNQSKPFQPMMAIGSSRSFYLGGKAQGSAQIGRLFMNTQNLLRRLYDNILNPGGPTSALGGISGGVGNPTVAPFDTGNAPADPGNLNYFINLDSEFFLIPFGLGVIFKTKAKSAIGGFYIELCVIPNYTVTITAGQSMIMEGVSLLYDRLFPLNVASSDTLLKVLDGTIPDVANQP
jgi:hypothetical protein